MSQDRIHDSNTIPFTMIPHEVVRDSATFGDIYEKMVYFVLKSHAVNGTGAFPSYATIAKEAQCSRDKAINCVKSLVSKKLITKSARKNSEGDQTSNVYTIENFESGLSQRLGVVVDNDWGSLSQRLGVVAGNDPKNNPIKNNPLSNSSSSEDATNHPDDLSKLVSFFQKEIGLASSYVIDDIQQTLEETSFELIQYALEQSVLNGARNWKYAKAIIKSYQQKNILTLEGIQLHEAKRAEASNRRNNRSNAGKTFSRYPNKPDMDEPKWVAKEKEEQQAFEEKRKAEAAAAVPDDAELDAILRALDGN